MPVSSTSTVSTTAKKRTRKVTTTAKKSVTKVKRTPRKSTSKVTTKKLKRPAKTVLTLNHYVRDYQSRVKIHNYEVQQFMEDLKVGYTLATQLSSQFVNYARESYKNHFNV
tara:strand:+ start:528 stop:860 length:333 start_codon:yes stop_codon:yes gene_type:complete